MKHPIRTLRSLLVAAGLALATTAPQWQVPTMTCLSRSRRAVRPTFRRSSIGDWMPTRSIARVTRC